jgi:hypothetical protein
MSDELPDRPRVAYSIREATEERLAPAVGPDFPYLRLPVTPFVTISLMGRSEGRPR